MFIPQYIYKAKVISVYDGDTCRVNIDLGCKTWIHNEPIRLFGLNTPEIRGEERELGLQVRDILRDWILDKDIILETIKDKKGKYGRYLGVIWLDGHNINEKLIADGLAERREY